ncbi:MAG: DUF4836 family protein [Bacteroides sp.]|nr:DUF4836 family protein [Bacteroides sp.]MCM1413966.1 DUF4836 family protein [Bacteroides sp.]MCM1471817.1 DUF4836 family protein [Bacteroides sp.]
MKKLHLLTLAACSLLMLAISSCSSKDMLDMVPDDVDYVATFNIEKMVKNAGFTITENDIKGPDDLKSELNSMPEDQRAMISDIYTSIDPARVLVFGYISADDPMTFGVAKITDKDKLEDILSDQDYEDNNEGGFDVYSKYKMHCVIDKDYAWVLQADDASDAATLVKRMKSRADDKDITSVDGVVDYLASDNAINCVANLTPIADLSSKYGYRFLDRQTAVALSTLAPYIKDKWAAASLDFTGNAFNFTASVFNPETGERLEVPGAKEIDTNLLAYLPENTKAAYAVGIDNQQLREMLTSLQPMVQNDPLATKALKQLGNIDGTIVAGFGFDNLSTLLDGKSIPDFALVVQLRPGKAATAKDVIVEAAQKFGATAETKGNSSTISVYGMPNFYVTTSGDCLVLSNKATVAKKFTGFKEVMKGKSTAFAFTIPNISKLTDGKSKMSIDGSITYAKGVIDATVEFGNYKGSLINEFIIVGNDINEKQKKIYEAQMASYDYNSYDFNDYSDVYAVDTVMVEPDEGYDDW